MNSTFLDMLVTSLKFINIMTKMAD